MTRSMESAVKVAIIRSMNRECRSASCATPRAGLHASLERIGRFEVNGGARIESSRVMNLGQGVMQRGSPAVAQCRVVNQPLDSLNISFGKAPPEVNGQSPIRFREARVHGQRTRAEAHESSTSPRSACSRASAIHEMLKSGSILQRLAETRLREVEPALFEERPT